MSPFPTNSNQLSASPPPSSQPSHFKGFSQPVLPLFPKSLHKQFLLPVFPILAFPNYNNYSSLSAQLSFSWLSCNQLSSLLTLPAQSPFNCPLMLSSPALLSFSRNHLLFSLCSISWLSCTNCLLFFGPYWIFFLSAPPVFTNPHL